MGTWGNEKIKSTFYNYIRKGYHILYKFKVPIVYAQMASEDSISFNTLAKGIDINCCILLTVEKPESLTETQANT